jgi:hypothetical protein
MEYNTVIRKVRKREHQNPEFGHKQGEIQNKPAKKYISIQGGSFTLYFFFLSASTAATLFSLLLPVQVL